MGRKSNETEIGADRIVDNQKDSINVNNIKGVKPNTAGVNTEKTNKYNHMTLGVNTEN